MLRCSDGSLYTGYTVDLRRRVAQHNSGAGSRYTASRLPVRLVYVEEARNLAGALRREFEIKKLGRGEKLRLCASQERRQRHSLR